MTWVRLDDGFADHPKIEAAGPSAAWLHVAALCYCSRHLTDGRMPAAKARRLVDARNPQQLIDRLLEVGLWETTEGGDYMIHDYLAYQPDAATVLARRGRDRARKAAGRAAQARDPATGRIMSVRNPHGQSADVRPESDRTTTGQSPDVRTESARNPQHVTPVPYPYPYLTNQVSSPTGRDATPQPVDNDDDDDSGNGNHSRLATAVAQARATRLGKPNPGTAWLRTVAASLDHTQLATLTADGITDPAALDLALDQPSTTRHPPGFAVPATCGMCRKPRTAHDPDCPWGQP